MTRHTIIRDNLKRAFLWASFSLGAACVMLAQETGVISGYLLDRDTGEPLIAARLELEGTELSTTSKLDGAYRFPKVNAGSYTLYVDKHGYRTARITEVEVVAGDLTALDIPMQATADNIIELEAFVVSASDVEDKGLKLLADRQQAASISDAIGTEDFSKFGAGDAADAMSRVTGVSINDGKYVFVRGLGERYSNTLMNGVTLPSADPDKKAVQMDMFPTDLLESIVTTKSFTPDKPGDFAGGSVNIQTKSFPELYTFSIGTSLGYNASGNLNSDFLSYAGGDTDIFGFDDGTRALPDGVPTDAADFPSSNFLPDAPEFFDTITRAFSPVISQTFDKSFLNTGFNVDFGNSYYLGNDQLIGVVASLTYDLSYDHYENGINARYVRDSIENDTLSSRYIYEDTRSTMSASLGSLLSLAYQPSINHEIALILSASFSGEDETRYQEGPTSDSGSDADSEDEVRSMVFTERSLISAQLKGEHFIEGPEIKTTWSLTSSESAQEDPDARYINNEIDLSSGRRSLVKPDRAPRRVFRDLTESQNSATFDIEIPIFDEAGLTRNLKFGGVYNKKERDFFEVVYQYEVLTVGNAIFSDFDTADTFLEEDMIGMLDDGPLMKRFINYFRGQSYEGEEEVTAVYGMLDYELNNKWRVIGGVRNEKTETVAESLTTVDERFFSPTAEINESKTLPAAQLVYSISDTQSIRASWSTTLARPTFREISPYRSFPFIGGDEYLGNQDLVLTDIENYDLRWEWYPNPGEIVSVSLFQKELTNPIELVIEEFAGNYRQRPYNVESGEIQGVEFEFRKGLYFIHESLEYFSINANLTYSTSEVDNSNSELIAQIPFFESDEALDQLSDLIDEFQDEFGNNRQEWDRERLLEIAPNTPSTRALFGQPDLIANLAISYDNPLIALSVSLNFNYVDQKLAFASQGATPDVYDAAREKLDLIISKGIGDYWSVKFSAKNLTDSKRERFYDSDDKDIYSSYKSGRTFSLSASYKFQ